MLTRLIGKLVCAVLGHRRGVRLAPNDPPHVPGDQNVMRYQCPRCLAIHTRKARKAKRRPSPLEAV